jgi:hypothetical protein
MCWKKKPVIVEPPVIVPPVEPLVLPYPEEAPDYTKTVANTNIDTVIDDWLIKYKVPEIYYSYWRNQIEIKVDDTLPYPAATWEQDGKRHLSVRPEYCNAGVIAHEQAHNSYSLLSGAERTAFSLAYNAVKDNPYIKLLYSINTYGLQNDIEAHAELYRYIGLEKLPATLRPYYRKL